MSLPPFPRAWPLALLAAALVPALSCSSKQSVGPTTLVIWEQMDPQERERFVENLAAFEASHPGVKIEHIPYETEQLRTKFQTAAAAGGGPQLIFGPSDQVGPLSLLGLIKPLDETLPAGFFDRFIPASLDTLDGHLWAAPDQVGNHLLLCYNKAMVKEAPETAEAFLAAAQAHTRPTRGGEQGQYGFAMNLSEPYWLVPFLTGFGGWVMDDERRPTLDTPAMREALAYLRDLKDGRKVMPRESDYQVSETLFKEGKAAMIVNGPWSWSGYREAGIDLGVSPIFRMPNGQWARPMVGGKGYSINANVGEDELPLVIELLTHLTSAESQRRRAVELGILPSHREVYADSLVANDPTLRISQRAFELGRRMPVVPEMRILWDVMRPSLQKAMNGTQSPEEAAREMQKVAVEQLEAMKK